MYLEDGKLVSLSILDTPGVENYRAMVSNLVKESDGIILMYDIKNEYCNSFDDIERWVDSIKEKIENYDEIPIILLGNKRDLSEKRVVTEEEGKQLAKKINAFKFLEISLKEDSQDYLKESIIIPLAKRLCEVFPEIIKNAEEERKRKQLEEEKENRRRKSWKKFKNFK